MQDSELHAFHSLFYLIRIGEVSEEETVIRSGEALDARPRSLVHMGVTADLRAWDSHCEDYSDQRLQEQ